MATTRTELPEGHVEVDWERWEPAGEGDVRSPCPAINALANHSILPHTGKSISKPLAVAALTQAFHLSPQIASIFGAGGIAANPAPHATTFDLDHVDTHGWIEHDVSLSRQDIAFGSNAEFSADVFAGVIGGLEEAATAADERGLVGWGDLSAVRWGRVEQSRGRHEREGRAWGYGVKEAVMSFGESALLGTLLGQTAEEGGGVPVEWVRVFFEEERLPFKEGWRPPRAFGQKELDHGYVEMLKAHPHPAAEAAMVGMGTLEALKAVLVGFGAGIIKSPFSSKSALGS